MRTRTARACITAAAAFVLLASLAACDASAETSQENRSFPFSGRSLTIDAHETKLTVVSGSGGEIEVERSLRGTAAKAGNATWSFEGDTLSLSVECTGIVVTCESEHRVRVPKNIEIRVKGTGANTRLEGLSGPITASLSHDSSLRVVRPEGRLRLRNGGGNITVTQARSSEVHAETAADGTISLSFAAAPRRVEAHAAESVNITLPSGSETYRVDAVGAEIPNDPSSDRLIVARTVDGLIKVRKAQ
ncbi:hypothetical protein [Thermostaphylospora chromogena]|uniref:Adhesin n=1 Tax=Thermostaphylospora chromogena TaxID=35622 RepID=A0A1H1HD70_9ACTN|nr:hypothetical protein [Thermostaphylospora chromogena]SDR23400.1 hypothetical protein SAMN04489764_4308 [Thermostaphylospora chromogena]